jgi:hypothetical protein
MMQVFLPHFVEIDTKSKSQLSWRFKGLSEISFQVKIINSVFHNCLVFFCFSFEKTKIVPQSW